MTKEIEYEDIKRAIKSKRIVALVPRHINDYARLHRDLLRDGLEYANFWSELSTPYDRIQAVRLASNRGLVPIRMKSNTYLVITDPYTMEALEIYGEKSNIMYVTIGGRDYYSDESDSLEKIYEQFFQPFQWLEETRGDLEE